MTTTMRATTTWIGDLVKQHNVRSIIVELSGAHAAAMGDCVEDNVTAIRALRAHGFRIGMLPSAAGVSERLAAITAEMDIDITAAPTNQKDVVEAVAGQLMASASGALLVAPQDPTETLPRGFSAFTHSFTSLNTLANELLQTDVCANRTTRLFGPHRVDFAQIFFESPLSFALVNLKPIVPGHTLVVPKRVVDRFHKLDSDEVADLWQTAQLVGQKIEAHYHANSLTFAIQDGVSAGQTVPHVHIHVLPRQDGDFNPNDKIYDEIEQHEKRLKMDNEVRAPRSIAHMHAEARTLSQLFN